MPRKMKAGGDLTGTSKAEKKARAAAFSEVDNKRVAQAKAQSQNGFKGESLNDHGLPDGRQARTLIEPERPKGEAGAKFRAPGAYKEGTSKMKVTKKDLAAYEDSPMDKKMDKKGAAALKKKKMKAK